MSKLNAPEILEQMAATYRERNAIYGDNWETHADAMRAIFPEGTVIKDFFEMVMFSWYSLIMGKMTRLANAKFRHQDSIHDIAVYAAMMEAFLAKNTAQPPAATMESFLAKNTAEGPRGVRGNVGPGGGYVLCYPGVPSRWHVKHGSSGEYILCHSNVPDEWKVKHEDA